MIDLSNTAMNAKILNLLLLAAGAALLLSVSPASAQTDPDQALKDTISDVIDVLYLPESQVTISDKRDRILSMMEEGFSFDFMIRGALSRNWSRLSPEQRETVRVLLADLLVRSFTKEFVNSGKPKISYGQTKRLSDTKLEVPSTVEIDGKTINLAYRMINYKSRWQVYDVLVEGVSMVRNYREQFDEHFRTKSASELIALLKEKLSSV